MQPRSGLQGLNLRTKEGEEAEVEAAEAAAGAEAEVAGAV